MTEQTDPPATEVVETPVVAPEGVDTPAVAAEGATETVTEPAAKPKKPLEDVFKGRVGHLTKQLSQKDEVIAAALARAEAAERLLQARSGSTDPEGGTTPQSPPAATPDAGKIYTEADVDRRAAIKIAEERFEAAAIESYRAGKESFPDWEDAVGNLKSLGLMSRDLLDAALATDASEHVIHHLGTDPEEAARIVSLSPARMGAELAKLATRLTAPKDARVSAAPAPINPVGGRVSPSVDLERAAEGSMAEYAAVRAKQGAPWAQRGGRSAA